jgi:glycosyltransferase involved in cell wall biosynthesis
MPRLLIATTVSTTIEAFFVPFAKHFRQRGWEVDALCAGALTSEAHAAFDQVHSARWRRNPFAPANLIQAIRDVQRVQEVRAYDIVHVHTPVAGLLTRLSLRRSRASGSPRVVYTAHGFHFHEGGRSSLNVAFRSIERAAGRWTDRLVVINDADARAALKYRIAFPEQLVRMPGVGVDTSKYSASNVPADSVVDVRRELGLAQGDQLVVMVAEFTPNKRQQDVVRALSLLPEPERTRTHVAFAGTGRTEPAVARLAEQLGISRRVHFLGFRRDIPALMRASAAVVLPSAREGLPRCLLEAMSLGVPFIASRTRGNADLAAGNAGGLFEVGDVRALSLELVSAFRDAERTRTRCANALDRVRAHDLTTVLHLHEVMYSELLSEMHTTEPATATASRARRAG